MQCTAKLLVPLAKCHWSCCKKRR